MKFSSSVVLLATASTSFAWSPLFERAPSGCIANLCLRAVTGTQPGQTQTATNRPADCSSYVGALGSVSTVTPAAVTVSTTLSFGASATSSLFTTTTTTTTTPVTTTITSSTILTVLSTTTTTTRTTDYDANLAKRVAPTVPAYASPCSTVGGYASACSCAGVTVSVTTLPVPTVTLTFSATVTSTFSVTSVSTSLVAAASTVTDFIAATSTTSGLIVSTSVIDGVIASCTPSATVIVAGQALTQVYAGAGNTINPSSAANADAATYPVQDEIFPGFLDKCDAVQQCVDWVYGTLGYGTADIHYLISEDQWVCTAYGDNTAVSSDYSVSQSNVGASFGYIVAN